jgi:hypothetical protein
MPAASGTGLLSWHHTVSFCLAQSNLHACFVHTCCLIDCKQHVLPPQQQQQVGAAPAIAACSSLTPSGHHSVYVCGDKIKRQLCCICVPCAAGDVLHALLSQQEQAAAAAVLDALGEGVQQQPKDAEKQLTQQVKE